MTIGFMYKLKETLGKIAGIISVEEFAAKKAELLSKI